MCQFHVVKVGEGEGGGVCAGNYFEFLTILINYFTKHQRQCICLH